ncbi:MAG TPA: hypothetical protein VH144_00505 [Candidatus Saccharimonadales bacterium]|jgi:hypothetical protein|nr:hypothetical protein [Candidatus Saccharimonadales bacterium]
MSLKQSGGTPVDDRLVREKVGPGVFFCLNFAGSKHSRVICIVSEPYSVLSPVGTTTEVVNVRVVLTDADGATSWSSIRQMQVAQLGILSHQETKRGGSRTIVATLWGTAEERAALMQLYPHEVTLPPRSL